MMRPGGRDAGGAGPPLIVQSDGTVLLETSHPEHESASARLRRFAELVKSPEHLHFYRISPLSVWNAAALGEPVEEVLEFLQRASRFPVEPELLESIREWYARYGLLELRAGPSEDLLVLHVADDELLARLRGARVLRGLLDGPAERGVCVPAARRGDLKRALLRLGYPLQDHAGYAQGSPLRFSLRSDVRLRPYQADAARAFWSDGGASGGCGVVVLPCGAGKTLVAMGVMELAATRTLVLSTNTVAVRQWRRELLEKSTLPAAAVGEYTGERKEVRPVTIATYQILTHRRHRAAEFAHLELLDRQDWGLVVYDEVHLLPAPVFRATARMQAQRRLGLTATLVREDGRAREVFTLIGPKRYELGWRELERAGYLAAARCVEVRVAMSPDRRTRYAAAGVRERTRLAATDPAKDAVAARLLRRHPRGRVLVIGQYLDQLRRLARALDLPVVTGRTPNDRREQLYEEFRRGRLRGLVLSKVGNFAIDLPDADVAIQVSGTFGSRQEEAQRLGRILRPKGAGGGRAVFYSLVTERTRDVELAAKRQLFLAQQGYRYDIVAAEELA